MSEDAASMTDEHIASIADRMIEEGRRVSPVTVWSEVNTGSIVEIAAALQRWQAAKQRPASQAQLAAKVPEDLAETLMEVARRLWAASREDAERVLNQRVGTLSDQLGSLLAERDEALVEYQKTREEAEKGRDHLARAAERLRASEASVQALQNALAAANARGEAAEARVAELLQRAVSAEDGLHTARASLEEQVRAQEALIAEIANRNDEIARIGEQHDEARQELATLGAACQAKSAEAERWSREASAATSRAEAAEAAAAQASEGLAQIPALEAQLDATRSALEAERMASAAHIDEAATRLDELGRITRAHEELSAVVARTAQELDEARQEIATLTDVCGAKSEEVERWTREASAAASRAQAAEAAAVRADAILAERAAREAEREAAHRALEAELEASREALAEERKSTASGLEQASSRTEELERLTRELGQAREQIGTLSGQDAAAHAELTRVAQEAVAARERADAAELHAAELEHRLAKQEHADAALKSAFSREVEIRATGGANADDVVALQRQVTAQAKAHEKAYGDLRIKAEQWVSHAKDLKQRLELANEKILFIDARSIGEVALMRKLSFELERLKPDHELVFREAQQRLIGEKMAQHLAQRGYRYDPATAVISKVK
jgi:chromosome segregation ATPase